MSSQIQPPDLLIYLRAGIPTLVDHIQLRGREYEGNMSLDYLRRLNERYENWISGYKEGKLLIINSDEVDFANNAEHLGKISKPSSLRFLKPAPNRKSWIYIKKANGFLRRIKYKSYSLNLKPFRRISSGISSDIYKATK